MQIELVAPNAGEMVLQVPLEASWMRIAQAFDEKSGWRVQSVLTGHEEIAPTTTAAIGALIAAAHEAFPGRKLEILDEVVPTCESCTRAVGNVRAEWPGLVLLLCGSCAEAHQEMAVAS